MAGERITLNPRSEDSANLPLDLHDPDNGISLLEHDYPVPEEVRQWAESADTEGALLASARPPVRPIPVKVRITETPDPAATNRITNPKAATGLTGITNVGGTLTRVALDGTDGPRPADGMPPVDTGVRVVAAAAGNRGAWDVAVTNAQVSRFSAWVYRESGAGTVGLVVTDAGGTVKSSSSTVSTSGQWTRLDVVVTPDATATWKLCVRQVSAGAATFVYTLGLDEVGSTLGPYFDGDSIGCAWSSTANASSSSRPATGGARFEAMEADLRAIVARMRPPGAGGTYRRVKPSGDIRIFDIATADINVPTDKRSVSRRSKDVTLTFTAQPYARGAQITGPTGTGSGPLLALDVPGVAGDVPARTTIVVTDSEPKSRRFVQWAAGGDASNANIIDSDSLVTSGFGGSGTTRTGAYDPNAAGNNVIRATMLGAISAVCGTGALGHVGNYRVFARVFATEANARIRLAWQDKDGPYASNDWAVVALEDQWFEVDLGVISITETALGAQTWTGRIEAYNATGGTLDVDFLALFPVDYGYGVARAVQSSDTGPVVAYDDFAGTTAGALLNGRVAPAGGTWATSGVATDFAFADPSGGGAPTEFLERTTASEASRRFGILGAANYADVDVSARVDLRVNLNGERQGGMIARWVDSSNYLTAYYQALNVAGVVTYRLFVDKVVGGVTTNLAAILASPANSSAMAVRLAAYADGSYVAQILFYSGSGDQFGAVLYESTGEDAVLATGGALDDGKPGIFDRAITAGERGRFDRFTVTVPPPRDFTLHGGRAFRIPSHGEVERASSDGTKYGRPSRWEGHRISLPPGDSRIVVRANRADLTVDPYAVIDDSLDVAVFLEPRYLV